jgi:hypothetical protein
MYGKYIFIIIKSLQKNYLSRETILLKELQKSGESCLSFAAATKHDFYFLVFKTSFISQLIFNEGRVGTSTLWTKALNF